MVTQEEHLKRITNLKRREKWKSIDPEFVLKPQHMLNFTHPNLLELEVSNLSPEVAAESIMNHIKKLEA